MHDTPDEEVFAWHGPLTATDEARAALEDLGRRLGLSFEEVLKELQRKRYQHLLQGRQGKLPEWQGDSLTTDTPLPTGKVLTITTYMGTALSPLGRATEITLREEAG